MTAGDGDSMILDKRPTFIKIIFDDLTSHHLRIPPRFMKHISKDMQTAATLKVPSGGRRWPVKVVRKKDGVFMVDGWTQFMTDNSLGDNEVLLFRYEGNMCFNVQIFDKNGSERVTYVSEPSDGNPTVFSGENSGGDGPRKNPITTRRKVSEQNKRKRSEEKESTEMEIQREERKSLTSSSSPSYSSYSPSPSSSSSPPPRKEKKTPAEGRAPPWKNVEPFTSSFPRFSVTLKHYNVRTPFILYIPVGFSEKYFPRTKLELQLTNSEGKSWMVRTIPAGYSHTINKGWRHFVFENTLQEDDTCIFELVKKYVLKVHVIKRGFRMV